LIRTVQPCYQQSSDFKSDLQRLINIKTGGGNLKFGIQNEANENKPFAQITQTDENKEKHFLKFHFFPPDENYTIFSTYFLEVGLCRRN
jgi:hypothetical protein